MAENAKLRCFSEVEYAVMGGAMKTLPRERAQRDITILSQELSLHLGGIYVETSAPGRASGEMSVPPI